MMSRHPTDVVALSCAFLALVGNTKRASPRCGLTLRSNVD
jgi:hypothetical protein